MCINFSDIIHIVQFKITNFIILLTLLQQLGQMERDISRLAFTIIFICFYQILLDNMQSLKLSSLKNF